jgi:geranylgeranyl reductase
MCDDKDVQRLTFDSYLYKRVVLMNPWQQLKLTLLTLGSVLRGNALAPASYKPVPSAVRTEEEAMAILAVSAIKGGIKVSSKKVPSQGLPAPESTSADDREAVGAGSNS